MNEIFDKLGSTLNDLIGSPVNNNVGWAWENMKPLAEETQNFAEGGAVQSETSSDHLPDWLKGTQTAIRDAGKSMSPYGGSYTNSPAYTAQHYTSMGKFFHVGEPTNNNSNRFPTTEKGKTTQSENPNDFFAKWYMGMRRMAEAQEVASRGQAGIRSK
jgi:hypothetical protein